MQPTTRGCLGLSAVTMGSFLALVSAVKRKKIKQGLFYKATNSQKQNRPIPQANRI
ncbi:hypothetical protein RSAG8_10301, partial [Rhizoctonia solani AG-8 WAC10335]